MIIGGSPVQCSHSVNELAHPQQDIFDFYSADRQRKIGQLVCHKTDMDFRPDYKGPTLAIDHIETTSHDIGYGTNIMRFAHEHSREIGCNGYMVLKADSSVTPERVPHVFYRKMGFSTQDKNIDNKLDRFIKENRSATSHDFSSRIMVYPPVHEPKTNFLKTLFQRAKMFFK